MMMKDRDGQIGEKFRAYFEGAGQPDVDMTAVKRAYEEAREEERRRRRKKRGRRIAVFSSLASCFLVAITLAFFPFSTAKKNQEDSDMTSATSEGATEYSYLSASAETLSLSRMNEDYADVFGSGFAAFSVAENATAEYTLYSRDGRELLLRADISIVGGGSLRATVFADLSGGQYVASELKHYEQLAGCNSYNGTAYRYETEYLNGEYESKAYCRNGEAYYVEVSSPKQDALAYLLQTLLK